MLSSNGENFPTVDGVSIHLHIHQKGNHLDPKDQATCTQDMPMRYDDKDFGEVFFSHTITRPTNGTSVGTISGTIVNGRVDRGIGRALPYSRRGSMEHPKRSFQSHLLVVQAKEPLSLDCALPELVVYLASLNQS